MTTPRDQPVGRGWAAALVAGPVLLTAGALLHPMERSDEAAMLGVIAAGPTRWWVAHLLLMAGAGALSFAAVAVGRIVGAGSRRCAQWGAGLAAIGSVAVVALVAAESVGGWALARETDRTAAATAYHDLAGATGTVLGLPSLALNAGLVLLAVGLARTAAGQRSARWTPWALGAGSLVLLVGNVGGLVPLLAAGSALVGVAIIPVGLPERLPRPRVAVA